MFASACVGVCIYLCVCMYTSVCVCICACMYVCECVSVCVCVSVIICVYILKLFINLLDLRCLLTTVDLLFFYCSISLQPAHQSVNFFNFQYFLHLPVSYYFDLFNYIWHLMFHIYIYCALFISSHNMFTYLNCPRSSPVLH